MFNRNTIHSFFFLYFSTGPLRLFVSQNSNYRSRVNHVACCITQQQQKVSTSNSYFLGTVICNWACNRTAGFATQRLGSNNMGFAGILQDYSGQNINVFFTSYFCFMHCQEPLFLANIFFTRSNSCIASTFTWS